MSYKICASLGTCRHLSSWTPLLDSCYAMSTALSVCGCGVFVRRPVRISSLRIGRTFCLHKSKVASRLPTIAYLGNVELLSVNCNLGLTFAVLYAGKKWEKSRSAQSRIIGWIQQLVQRAALKFLWSHFHTFHREDSKC